MVEFVSSKVLDLLVSRLSACRNQSNLQVKLEFHLKTGRGTAFKVYLANAGKQLVSVKEAFLRLKSGEKWSTLWGGIVRPIELKPSQSHEMLFPLHDMCDKVEGPLDVVGVEVYDTTGKKYTCKVSRKLRSQIKAEWSPESE